MGLKIYLNGKLVEKEQARVSVFDHGLLYGDGVFEGIRAYHRLVFKLKEHIDRLYESAHTLMLKIPLAKQEMIKAVVETLKANNLSDAYIRLVVTRGEGDLGLDPRKCHGQPNIIIITDKIILYPEKLYKEGLEIITVPTVRNLPEALNPQLKSLNYLNNILAKIEATNAGYQEAIMLDSLGYVAECTGDNIFIVKRGELYTPPQCMGTLRGITREAVLEIARKKRIATHEHVLTRHEVFISDEVFLTGTAAEIIPVVKVDGRQIGDGKPGKLTKSLRQEFQKLTQSEGVKY
jgi:branched-chain amino acid aminotransferase